MPNGLHAYYLSGFGAQHRFDAQLSVANDPARADKLVINGESCFRCHAGGLNIRVDEVGLQLAPGSAARAYYPEPSKLAAQFQQDNAQYRGALKKLGYDEAMGEPIDRVIRTFKQDRGVEDIREQAGETDAVFGG